MKDQLTTFFTFSKKELNGIFVLFILVALITVFPLVYPYFDEPETYEFDQFAKEIALFKASEVSRNVHSNDRKGLVDAGKTAPQYFKFDPNTASEPEWIRLGLSAKQIKVISNYRSKGGKFYQSEDLKKIYSITEKQYKGLEPYIHVKASWDNKFSDRKMPKSSGAKRKNLNILELNAADSAMLDQLRGIGPAFASRIIKYRNRLGGFYERKQLQEVYGMDSVRYIQLESQVTVDASLVKRLNINRVVFEEVRGHPYLSFKHINALIQYRKQHGSYTSVEDLKKVLILNEEIIRKIGPYLSYDP